MRGLRRSSTWFDLVVVGGGSGLLAVYFLAGVGEWLGRVAGMVAGFDSGGAAMAGGTVLLGLVAAEGAFRAERRRAEAAWLTVLPWPEAARWRAVALSALATGAAQSVMVAAAAGWGARAVRSASPTWDATVVAAWFGAGFGAGLAGRLRKAVGSRARAGRVVAVRQAPLSRAFRWVDRGRPRWLGIWDSSGRGWWFVGGLGLAFVVGGGAAAAAGVLHGRAWPAIGMGVVGGNAVFAAGLRGEPLRSPVCRAAPLGFVAAWLGVQRVAWAVSLLWFMPLAAAGVAAEPGRATLAGTGLLALAGLNGGYAALAGFSPNRPRFTAGLYAVLLVTTAKETLELGEAVVPAMAAFLLMLWWLGRRRYRAHG